MRLLGIILILGLVISGLDAKPRKAKSPESYDSILGTDITQDQLRSQVIRFVDEYTVHLGVALTELIGETPTPEDRHWARTMMLVNGSAGFTIASGDRPIVNLLDLVALISLTRMEMEDYWKPNRFGERLDPMIQVMREQEAAVWELAETVLSNENEVQLAALLKQWRLENPEMRYTAYIRFQEFALQIKQPVKNSGGGPSSLLGLLYLDPLAGLDPTVRAIEQSKILGERLMYYSQRLPYIVRWQTMLFVNDVAQSEEVQTALLSVERFSFASESIAKSIEELPEDLGVQREAAIKQLLDGIATERQALLHFLREEQIGMTALTREINEAVNSSDLFAQSLNTTIQSTNELLRIVDELSGEPDPDAPPGEPFRILEYAETATQLEAAAREITELVNAISAHSEPLINETSDSLRQLSNHIFKLLVLLALVVFTLALLYRFIAVRILTATK